MDYSRLSDDELLQMAQQRGLNAPTQAPAQPDFSGMSDAELVNLAKSRGMPVSEGNALERGARYVDNIVRQIANGATFGFADELAAGAGAATGVGGEFGEYDKNLEGQRARDKAFQAENPVASTAANVAGGVAGTVATPLARLGTGGATLAARMGNSALAGSGMGAAYGFGAGEGGFANRAQDAAEGAALGGALGAFAPAAVEGVSAGFRRLAQPIVDRIGPANAGARRVVRALERDGMTPDQLSARLQELGPDATIANAGGANLKGLAEVVAQTPGKGMAAAQKALYAQAEAQPGRAVEAVNLGLSGRDAVQTADDIIKSRAQSATPLYDEAFQGGSTAPLQVQLENAFAQAATDEGAASQALQAAQRNMTLARAGVQRAGNDVYAANTALAAEREASAQMQAAQQALQQAQTAKAGVLERLRVSQNDAATNAPGAVWSPRIQQFLDDPIAKAGLAKGMEVQRLEALAQGRAFNPSELAITGMDEAGMPVVSQVPNLRTLDAVKRGLDDIIEAARDPVTKSVKWDQRLRAVEQVRSALVRQLDDLTGGAEGAYAQARAAWAGPSKALDALSQGRGFNNVDPRTLQKIVAGMSDGEQELFRTGVADKVREIVSRAQDGSDVTRRIFGNDRIRQQLQAAFPDEESYQAFSQEMERLAGFARDKNQMLGNSRTAFRQAGQEDLSSEGAAGMIGDLLTGGGRGVLTGGARSLANMLRRPPEAVTNELAPMLFSQGDNAANIAALSQRGKAMQLSADQRRNLARLLMQGGGVGSGYAVTP